MEIRSTNIKPGPNTIRNQYSKSGSATLVYVLFYSLLYSFVNIVYGRRESTKQRCRLSWLTNSALVYEPKCVGRGGVAGSQSMSTAVHMKPK
jgi:hypothetical protein